MSEQQFIPLTVRAKNQFVDKLLGWFTALLVSIGALLSGQITGCIQKALNKAQLRKQAHEDISKNLSSYMFHSDNLIQFLKRKELIKRGDFEAYYVKDYNQSISRLRELEYKYIADVRTQWNEPKAAQLKALMKKIKAFDLMVHNLNPLFYKLPQTDEALKALQHFKKRPKCKEGHRYHAKRKAQLQRGQAFLRQAKTHIDELLSKHIPMFCQPPKDSKKKGMPTSAPLCPKTIHKSYNTIAKALAEHISHAKHLFERLQEGSVSALPHEHKKYQKSYINLQTHTYVYQAKIGSYWRSKRANQLFQKLIPKLERLHQIIHMMLTNKPVQQAQYKLWRDLFCKKKPGTTKQPSEAQKTFNKRPTPKVMKELEAAVTTFLKDF